MKIIGIVCSLSCHTVFASKLLLCSSQDIFSLSFHMVASSVSEEPISGLSAVPQWCNQAQTGLNNDGKDNGDEDGGICKSLYSDFTKGFHLLLLLSLLIALWDMQNWLVSLVSVFCFCFHLPMPSRYIVYRDTPGKDPFITARGLSSWVLSGVFVIDLC